jgi:hypothetical protein
MIVSSMTILIFVMQVFFRGLPFSAHLTSQVFCRWLRTRSIHHNLRSGAFSRMRLLSLSSMYAKPSTCVIGCFRSVIGGALVELYDSFTLHPAFLNLAFDSTQGLRISSLVLPSYRFVINYQVETL